LRGSPLQRNHPQRNAAHQCSGARPYQPHFKLQFLGSLDAGWQVAGWLAVITSKYDSFNHLLHRVDNMAMKVKFNGAAQMHPGISLRR
jgi:hypothetical protein